MQNLQNIFTTKNIIIYFIIINIIGFLIMYIDKQKAKKGKWRIPEKTLFMAYSTNGENEKSELRSESQLACLNKKHYEKIIFVDILILYMAISIGSK